MTSEEREKKRQEREKKAISLAFDHAMIVLSHPKIEKSYQKLDVEASHREIHNLKLYRDILRAIVRNYRSRIKMLEKILKDKGIPIPLNEPPDDNNSHESPPMIE